jgi:hypothetical protein
MNPIRFESGSTSTAATSLRWRSSRRSVASASFHGSTITKRWSSGGMPPLSGITAGSSTGPAPSTRGRAL